VLELRGEVHSLKGKKEEELSQLGRKRLLTFQSGEEKKRKRGGINLSKSAGTKGEITPCAATKEREGSSLSSERKNDDRWRLEAKME